MTFADLRVGYIVLAVLVCALLVRRGRKKNCFAHSMAHQPVLEEMHASHLRLVPAGLRGLAVVAVGLALMDPRLASRERLSRFEGLDIISVIDLSSSMLEALGGWEEYRQVYDAWAASRTSMERSRDQAQMPKAETRLDAVKNGLAEFISKRTEDRIALIAFSEQTYIISPLTTDHRYLGKYISMIDGSILIGEGVSAIGDGLAEAMVMFRKQGDPETRNKVIVLFTDGEHNSGRDPLEVLSEARYYGYRVYLVGVDVGPEVARKEKVQALVQAVQNTGGQYYDATDKAQLAETYRSIDRLERGVFTQRTVERNVPAYMWFAWLSFAFVLCASVLDAVPYFVDIS